MKNLRTSGRTEFLFTMLLFFVFLLCSVFTVLIGSRVYENIRARDNASFYRDTAISYAVNKVRQADRTGAVEIREENGVSILVLTSEINGSLYETWIYTMDGSLRELFTPKDSGLTAADGLPVSECPEMTFSLEEKNGKLLLTIEQEGGQNLSIFLRSAPGTFSEKREEGPEGSARAKESQTRQAKAQPGQTVQAQIKPGKPLQTGPAFPSPSASDTETAASDVSDAARTD